jgi:hypothetical protein
MKRILFYITIFAVMACAGGVARAVPTVQKINVGDGVELACKEASYGHLDCDFTVYLTTATDSVPYTLAGEETDTFHRYLYINKEGGQIYKVYNQIECSPSPDMVICDVPLNEFFDGGAGPKEGMGSYTVNMAFDMEYGDVTLDFVTAEIKLSDVEIDALPPPAVVVDEDGDHIDDSKDNCLDQYNPDQEDTDGDGIGDWCDNCMFKKNKNQADSDEDGFGDVCALDADGDGVLDANDNCPTVDNPDQKDSNHDGRGDACQNGANPNVDTPTPGIQGIPSYGYGGCQFTGNASGDGRLVLIIQTLILISLGLVRMRKI